MLAVDSVFTLIRGGGTWLADLRWRRVKSRRRHCEPWRFRAIAARRIGREPCCALSGWTSPRIAEAFGVREDTVRLWRSDFVRGGVEALKTSPAPGPAPVKAEAALRVATPLLEAPVADRHNWTLARLIGEIREPRGRHHFQIASVQGAAQKKFRWRRPRHTLKGRQDCDAVDRVGLRLTLRKAQAEAGDIVLLFADESEALTHPYLARAWASV